MPSLVQRTKAAVGSGGVFKGCTSFAGATLPKSIKQVSFDAFDGCPCEDEFDCEFEDDEYVLCISMAEGRARAMEKVVRELEALLKKIDY